MLHREQESPLKPSRPYRDYIAWLQQQDLKKAEAYWREMLKGYTESTPLGVDQGSEDLPDLKQIYDEQSCRLPESSTTALRLVAQQNHLTLNTMIQGAWALVLGGYSGKDDVVFGVTSTAAQPTWRASNRWSGSLSTPSLCPYACPVKNRFWIA